MVDSGRIAVTVLLLAFAACAPAKREEPVFTPGGSPMLSPPTRTRDSPALGAERGHELQRSLPGANVVVHPNDLLHYQQETSIAADPTDPDILVAAWQDLDTIKYGWTSDGGATWQSSTLAFPSLPGQRYFDPFLTVDSAGTFYMTMIGFGAAAPAGTMVAKSTDGGTTFTQPVLVGCCDKPSITTDPANGNAYVIWTDAFDIAFAASTDGGATFTPGQVISNAGSIGNGALPAVGPNGEIYVVWGLATTDNSLWFDRSLDGGATWLIDEIEITRFTDPRQPLKGLFRNPPVPAIAVDRSGGPHHGRIHVVFPDGVLGDPDIMLAWSDDHGDNWSTPLRVNDDVVGNDADQWFPWVAVDVNGHVHVTFLDRRDDPDGLLYAMYLATSTNGGVSFGPNVRVSDGLYGPTNHNFLGDYTGAAVTSAPSIHPVWPDGRNGTLDVFTHAVDLVDYDEDGILNDGDGSGQYADNRCASGQSTTCDDNCPGTPNIGQADQEGDAVGDLCDNCPATANVDQFDRDRDGIGDACDPCPDRVGGDSADPDGDTLPTCADNCPWTPNVPQTDADGDGKGDVCDTFPTDPDDDSVMPGTDNCMETFNPAQLDSDGDGVGDLCDTCPDVADAAQLDSDGDGRGDACDCETEDATDRLPPSPPDLLLARGAGSETVLTWGAPVEADVFSVTRGSLSLIAGGDFGPCLDEGLLDPATTDSDEPAPGEVFVYLVQAQNFECGLGPLGWDSGEALRVNGNTAACGSIAERDRYANSEVAVTGIVVGRLVDTLAADGVFEEIAEVTLNQNGVDYGALEHRWTFLVPPNRKLELHLVAYRGSIEHTLWDYSTDGGAVWTPIDTPDLPLSAGLVDLTAPIPATLQGQVMIRVVDEWRYPTPDPPGIVPVNDRIFIDELFLRAVP